MKKTTLLLSCLLVSAPGQAADIDNGKKLHEERCTRCHGSEVYTRSNRRVKSFDKLASQVRFCKNQTGVMWFDDEVNDVIHYLNDSFYQFK